MTTAGGGVARPAPRTAILAVAALGAAIVACEAAAPGPGRGAAAAPGEAVSLETLRANLRYLASDELGGRAAGSPGHDAAAAFVEQQLRDVGVDPLFPTGDAAATSLRQPFTLAHWDVAPGGSLHVRDAVGSRALELLEELQIVFVTGDGAWRGERRVVFVGAGVVEPDLGHDDFAAIDVDGACVVILFDLPEPLLRDAPPELRERNPPGDQSLVRRVGHAASRGATCAITIAGPESPAFWGAFMADRNPLEGRSVASDGRTAMVPIAVALGARGASRLFAGQRGDPSLDATVTPFELDGTLVEFDLEVRAADRLATHNVGGWIGGTDGSVADEVIVLSAHLDGQGTRADGVVLNSANDNAASVVALLEATRLLAAAPSRRPVIVLFTSAEEDGLAGAYHFVNDPPIEFHRIGMNVNLEMVGKRRTTGTRYEFRVAGRHSDDIEHLVDATRRRHGEVEFDYERRFETPDYRFRRADHAHFFLAGVPTIYFYGGGADYHQPSDDADRIEYDKVRTMAEVLVDLVRTTDDLDVLPRSDGRS